MNPNTTRQKDLCNIESQVNSVCSNGINDDFKTMVKNTCLNHLNCTIELNQTPVYPAYPPLNPNGTVDETVTSDQYATCKAPKAIMFVQYTCAQTEDVLQEKRKQGSLIACLGVFACLIFMTTIYFLKKNSKIKNLEWDVSTITAGDYTVEYKIS